MWSISRELIDELFHTKISLDSLTQSLPLFNTFLSGIAYTPKYMYLKELSHK
jgi:hypothetical protein